MYCKHCGKEIDDNSSYCKHCGKSQGKSTIPTFNKMWVCYYAIWVIINFLCLYLAPMFDRPYFDKGDYSYSSYTSSEIEIFFPFPNWRYITHFHNFRSGWLLGCYDLTEFIVYVFLLPLIAFCIYRWYKNRKSSNGIVNKD